MDAFARIVPAVVAAQDDAPDVQQDVQGAPPGDTRRRRTRQVRATAPASEAQSEGGARRVPARRRVGSSSGTPAPAPGASDAEERRIRVYSAFDDPGRVAATSLSDEENVIMQLKVTQVTSSDSDDDIVPDAYNNHASSADTFVSKWAGACCGATDATATMTVPATTEERGGQHCQHGQQGQQGQQGQAPDAGALAAGSPMGARVVRLLMDFEEKSKVGEWPSNTSVHCYWCCHRFDTVPLGLPIKYVHDKFRVTGCFCSLECAASWNFASRESLDEMYERYMLLNLMASHIGYGKVVYPAPDRTVLSMFGGYLNVDEFRRMSSGGQRVVLTSYPPMMSVQQQVEEVNACELKSEYKFVPLDSDRVNKYQEKLRLRRTKPLVNFKNTLDCTMNLRYT